MRHCDEFQYKIPLLDAITNIHRLTYLGLLNEQITGQLDGW